VRKLALLTALVIVCHSEAFSQEPTQVDLEMVVDSLISITQEINSQVIILASDVSTCNVRTEMCYDQVQSLSDLVKTRTRRVFLTSFVCSVVVSLCIVRWVPR
jgi:hypothetical protein